MKSNVEKLPRQIEIPVWWSTGEMSYRRDALPMSHPESTYNYIKNVLGLIPEEYGIAYPFKCPCCGQQAEREEFFNPLYKGIEHKL